MNFHLFIPFLRDPKRERSQQPAALRITQRAKMHTVAVEEESLVSPEKKSFRKPFPKFDAQMNLLTRKLQDSGESREKVIKGVDL
ncbi:hypothetical protein CEXT_454871 [Caerostris extrusa]|uniref:Uncharacterized protein n=1 Tax=Caerostris extrusa TaxID=172846 RepID=A0AAV4MTT0_CAEEX|nr:hypothetical protein CEXT_454871 [Caerostris extrusa]